MDRDPLDDVEYVKRARARRDTWVLLGVCAAVAVFIVFMLWLNRAFESPTG